MFLVVHWVGSNIPWGVLLGVDRRFSSPTCCCGPTKRTSSNNNSFILLILLPISPSRLIIIIIITTPTPILKEPKRPHFHRRPPQHINNLQIRPSIHKQPRTLLRPPNSRKMQRRIPIPIAHVQIYVMLDQELDEGGEP